MPLRSRSPTSSNARPEPETRSYTVADTSTSPARRGGDARADVDGDSGNLVAEQLALARVQAGAELEPEVAGAVPDGERAPNRARRPVERGEEAVAGGVDLAAAEPLELATDGGVVTAQQLRPVAVAESLQPLGRADEVGEEDGGEDTIGLGCGLTPVASSSISSRIRSRSSVHHE